MFVFGPQGAKMMKPDDHEKWMAMLVKLRVNQVLAGTDDPVLFHGTSQKNAAAILANGFDPGTSWVATQGSDGSPAGPEPCVYWASGIETAVLFAEAKSSEENGFPVIFAARASALARSGTLVPDLCAWGIDTDEDETLKPADWRESLARFGAVAVLDCRHVPNLKLHAATPQDVGPDRDYIAEKTREHIREIKEARDKPRREMGPSAENRM